MPSITHKMFTPEYREQAFAMWYASNKCTLDSLVLMLPETEHGEKPQYSTVVSWKHDGRWVERAANLDLEVQTQLERELVGQRVEMMKRHAEFAQEIVEKAMEKLRVGGFDTSASAVAALRVGFDEEKKSRGMEVALTRIAQMDDEQLNKTFIAMLGKVGNIDLDTIDGDVEEEDEHKED